MKVFGEVDTDSRSGSMFTLEDMETIVHLGIFKKDSASETEQHGGNVMVVFINFGLFHLAWT